MVDVPKIPRRSLVPRKPHWSIKFFDVLSRSVITVGGLGTILAVMTVFFFLLYVVIPLFKSPEVGETKSVGTYADSALADLRLVRTDDHRIALFEIDGGGAVRLRRLDNGAELSTAKLTDRPVSDVTAMGVDASGAVVLGFVDGSARIGKVEFKSHYFEPDDHPDADKSADIVEMEGSVAQYTSEDQWRVQALDVTTEDPIPGLLDEPVRRIEFVQRTLGPMIAALGEPKGGQSRLVVRKVRKKYNMLLDETTYKLSGAETHVDLGGRGLPRWLRLTGLGDEVMAVWDDGTLQRYRVPQQDGAPMVFVEEVDVLANDAATITACTFIIGRETLLVGDSTGGLTAWFRTLDEDDNRILVRGHELPTGPAPVTAIARSVRTRLVSVGHADGTVRVIQVTTAQSLMSIAIDGAQAVNALALTSKDDGVLAYSGGRVFQTSFDVGHPEANLTSLFRPMWYETYQEPGHTWETEGGSDAFESKFGVMPLVFGTLKATVYSLLFGVPIALLAAIFTSEFMHPKTRSRIKPTVEIMASLPSVVLGFIAALVIAPFVEDIMPEVLATTFSVPLALLVGALLWQGLSRERQITWEKWRLLTMFAGIVVGIGLAFLVIGPLFRSLLFAGDLKIWLEGHAGSGFGGWFLLLIPLAAITAWFVMTRIGFPKSDADKSQALVALIRFGVGLVLTLVISAASSGLLLMVGWDPRGGIMSTYVQRNALIVGFVMGFAIIPIIYSIAEDALTSVPDHLRAASLGAGATQWQTATRIVVPTAMSGLFSAVMIGIGRAVGETMIVLMAAGNTPLMETNMFNGFQTLSAAIATELPEAVRDSTHYRTLFFAGFLLFCMTFVLNTAAELVRQRSRKRAKAL